MNASDSEGLGLSVLVYLGVVLGALALLATPVYYVTRAEVHQNPVLAQSNPLLQGNVITDRATTRFALERLQKQNMADAESVTALKPKTAKKAEPPQKAAARPAKRDGTPVAELQTERNRASVPFSLF